MSHFQYWRIQQSDNHSFFGEDWHCTWMCLLCLLGRVSIGSALKTDFWESMWNQVYQKGVYTQQRLANLSGVGYKHVQLLEGKILILPQFTLLNGIDGLYKEKRLHQ